MSEAGGPVAGPTLLNTDVSDEEAEALELRSLVGDAGFLIAEGSSASVRARTSPSPVTALTASMTLTCLPLVL